MRQLCGSFLALDPTIVPDRATNDDSHNPYAPPKDTAALMDERPTCVRYQMVLLLVLMSILLYLDRFCLGAVQKTMIGELGVTKEAFGRAVGGFFFAYALLMVPTGWLADRLGVRVMLTTYALLWGLATILLGLVRGLEMVLLARILIGVSQSGAYASAAIVLKRWIPATGRARASSLVTTGGRFGGLLAFLITPLLASAAAEILGWESGGWRFVFAAYGAVTIIWAVAFWFSFRNQPTEHPACNAGEQATIAGVSDRRSEEDASALPQPAKSELAERSVVLTLAASPTLWFLSFINILQNVGWIFLVTWLTQYLIEHYQEELKLVVSSPDNLAGPLTALAALAGMIGNLTGGVLSDVSVVTLGRRWGRRVPGLCAGCLAGSMYLIAWGSGNLWLTVAVMAGAYFFADLALGSMWATLQDVGGRRVGSILGFTNMCGNLAAAGTSWAFGYLADRDQWPAVFLISAGAFFLVAACWLGVDASKPLVPEET